MPHATAAIAVEPPHRALIRKAVKIKGSQAALATQMGYSQQFISWLLNDAEQVTAEVAAACDTATGGVISKHDLRPDLFGPRVTVQ